MKLITKGFLFPFFLIALVLSIAYPHNVSCEAIEITSESQTVECAALKDEEVRIGSRLMELFFGKNEAKGDTVLLIPGGSIFGAKIKQSYVSVQSPGEVHELKAGDKILSVNGASVYSAT